MSDHDQIERQIKSILEEKASIDLDPLNPDLIEGGVLDSLTFVEVLFEIEQRFGVAVDITAVELDDFRTLASIANFVIKNS